MCLNPINIKIKILYKFMESKKIKSILKIILIFVIILLVLLAIMYKFPPTREIKAIQGKLSQEKYEETIYGSLERTLRKLDQKLAKIIFIE
jgi:predicted PurR-regulated permease PerM